MNSTVSYDQLEKRYSELLADWVHKRNHINNIAYALGTAETADALVEVARNAHKAEQELASWINKFGAMQISLEDAYEYCKRNVPQ